MAYWSQRRVRGERPRVEGSFGEVFPPWIGSVLLLGMLAGMAGAITIETLVLSTDDRPEVEGIYNSIDGVKLLANDDVIFAAGSRRGEDDAVGMFAARLGIEPFAIAQAGVPPFSIAQGVRGVPGVGWAANRHGMVTFDAVFSRHLHKYDAAVSAVPYPITFGNERPVTDLPSGVTGSSFEGRFSGRLEGVVINDAGEVFFEMPFGGANINPFLNGLFVNSPTDQLTNVVYEGDPVPGITGARFANFGRLQSSANGSFIFESKMALGSGITSGNDDTVWRHHNGSLELLLREGGQAPGMAEGFSIFTTQVTPGVGQELLFSGTASDGQGTLIEANWRGSGPEDFAPFAIVSPDVSTRATIDGQPEDVYFTALQGGLQASPAGDIFFSAAGALEPDGSSPVAGLWKIDAGSGQMSLFLRETDTFTFLNAIDINARGQVAIKAFVGNRFFPKESIWLVEPDGTATPVVTEGDQLAEQTVRSIARGSVQLNDAGNLVFIAEFGIALNYDREGAFLALGPRAVQDFVWSGDAGDDDWHKPLNWDDDFTGDDAPLSPGSAGGTESVKIDGAAVRIDSSPVHIKSIEATGSLEANHPLTIEAGGEIENLSLGADMSLGGSLLLLGQAGRWRSGSIGGVGPLTIERGHKVTIHPPEFNGEVGLSLPLIVAGQLVQDGDEATLKLEDAAATVTVKAGGRYEARGTGVVGIEDQFQLVNEGELVKTAAPTSNFFVGVENKPGAKIKVEEGNFIFRYDSKLAGELVVDSGARATFFAIPTHLGTETGSEFAARGGGEIWLESLVWLETDCSFAMTGEGAKLRLGPSANLNSSGNEIRTLRNTGNMEVHAAAPSGRIDVHIENEGDLTFVGDAGLHPLHLESYRLTNGESGKIIHEGAGTSRIGFRHDLESAGDFLIKEGTLELNGKTTLTGGLIGVETGAALKFSSRDAVELMSSVTFEGAGRVALDGVEVSIEDGMKPTSRLTGAEGGLEMMSGAKLSGPGWFVNEGLLMIREGSVENGVRLINQGGEEGPLIFEGASDDPRFLNGKLLNNTAGEGQKVGVVLQRANVVVGQEGEIENQGQYVIEGAATIVDLTMGGRAGPLFKNVGPAFRLTKRGPGEAEIAGRFYHESGLESFWPGDPIPRDGVIHVEGGTLALSGGGVFAGRDAFERETIIVALNGGDFVLRGANEFRFEETTAFLPGERRGKFIIDAPVTMSPQFVIGTDSEWRSGTLRKLPTAAEANLIVRSEQRSEGVTLRILGERLIEGPTTIDVFQGATVLQEGDLTLRDGGIIRVEGGYLVDGKLNLGPNGRFLNDSEAVLVGRGVIGATLANSGNLAPGQSAGSLTVDGDFEQTSTGVLEIEIGGLEAGTGFDQLVVNGTARLAGDLVLSGIDGFFPADGAQVQVLAANLVEGQFDRVTAARPSGRQTYDVMVGNGGVTLEASRLDPTTYEEWKAGVFTPADQADPSISGPLANPDRDGLVNLFEYVYDRRPNEIDREPLSREMELTAEGRIESVTVSFPWADGMTDATYQLESSTDLETWVPAGGDLTIVDEGVTDQISVKVPYGGFVNDAYLRLVVVLE